MRKRKGDHIIISPNGIGCTHCGEEQAISYPCDLNVMMGIHKGFRKSHLQCRPQADGRRRFEFGDRREWADSWDTGISSLTIYYAFTGTRCPCRPDVPYDPDDFGRCYRLLKVAPEWRSRLHVVVEKFPAWRLLVEHWDELERLYEEELPTGEAPKLYERMKDLRRQAEAVAS